MFLNYLAITIFTLHISVCYVTYEQFAGFNVYNHIQNGISRPAQEIYTKYVTDSVRHRKISSMKMAKAKERKQRTLPATTSSIITSRPLQSPVKHRFLKDVYDKILHGIRGSPAQNTTQKHVTEAAHQEITSILPSSATAKETTEAEELTRTPAMTIATTTKPLVKPIKNVKFNCPEDERPFNIGTYEVPTQRDVVLQIQKTLRRAFSQYRVKALDFLQDIRQATVATSDIEKKCHLNRPNHRKNYKICVKNVSRKCELITKILVMSLERQRTDVSAFMEGTICNITAMKADPLQLIKTLAMEQASLEFALPGFLRLLGSCSAYCDKILPAYLKHKTPIRHMTDQELVVKHLLTNKSYAQLIN